MNKECDYKNGCVRDYQKGWSNVVGYGNIQISNVDLNDEFVIKNRKIPWNRIQNLSYPNPDIDLMRTYRAERLDYYKFFGKIIGKVRASRNVKENGRPLASRNVENNWLARADICEAASFHSSILSVLY